MSRVRVLLPLPSGLPVKAGRKHPSIVVPTGMWIKVRPDCIDLDCEDSDGIRATAVAVEDSLTKEWYVVITCTGRPPLRLVNAQDGRGRIIWEVAK